MGPQENKLTCTAYLTIWMRSSWLCALVMVLAICIAGAAGKRHFALRAPPS